MGPGMFLVAGDNAQGKSNLCEAIHFLSTLRSFRATSERELVRWESAGLFTRINATVMRAHGPLDLDIVIGAKGKPESMRQESIPDQHILGPGVNGPVQKRVKVNGAPKRAIDCVGMANVVLFEPADLDLVTGAPQGRRRFLDVTLCQMSHGYCRMLTAYQRIIVQRAALLKRIRERQDGPASLNYWNELLAQHAVAITLQRASLIERCTPIARQIAQELGGKQFHLLYRASYGHDPTQSKEELQSDFLAHLSHVQRREIDQGVNLLGPHRDDLGFAEGDIDIAIYGSRGQQRIAALSLKLAELQIVHDTIQDQPILVLDDVLSELDHHRRDALLKLIPSHTQVIMTTAEPEYLPPSFLDAATTIYVENGSIVIAK